jgi:hypothetical protein
MAATKTKPAAKKAPAQKPASKPSPPPENVETYKHTDSACTVTIKGSFDREGMIGLAKRVNQAAAELF